MNPIVSIIIPSFNKEKYIAETIKSVIAQTYLNWEMIILDDVSTDRTVEIISPYTLIDERIHLMISAENHGANYLRNLGLSNAKGQYIMFLDADDLLSNTCIENRIKAIDNSAFDFCVHTMGVFYKFIGDSEFLWQPNSKNPLTDFLQHKLPWSIMQPIWKKDFLLKIGGFNENFKRMQDVEMHTRALFFIDVNYKQFNEKPDCFYRIDEERKNFGNYVFLDRWVESAVLYFNEFYIVAKKQNNQNYLIGTLFKTHLQILHYYKTKKISKTEYSALKDKLFCDTIISHINFKNKLCFKFSEIYNQLPFRIPGVNFIINRILFL